MYASKDKLECVLKIASVTIFYRRATTQHSDKKQNPAQSFDEYNCTNKQSNKDFMKLF